MPESTIDLIDNDFVTVVADGAYTHFQEGFVSLLFYRDNYFPKHEPDKKTIQKFSRRILFEVRLATNQAKNFNEEIASGLDLYDTMGLWYNETGRGRDSWVGLEEQLDSEVTHMRSIDLNERERQSIQAKMFHDAYAHMSKEGRIKLDELLRVVINENMDKIKAIAERYPKKNKQTPKGTTENKEATQA